MKFGDILDIRNIVLVDEENGVLRPSKSIIHSRIVVEGRKIQLAENTKSQLYLHLKVR